MIYVVKLLVLVLLVNMTNAAKGFPDIKGPITQDFQNWLSTSKYSSYDFARTDIGTDGLYGSYGGRNASGQTIVKQPIVFIHGNSDRALNDPDNNGIDNQDQTGWSENIQYFLDNGYTTAELYATTWGPSKEADASQQTHNCAYLQLLRAFTEAVIEYTAASKIDVVTHSMGVTLGRKVLLGGSSKDSSHDKPPGGTCDLGPNLAPNIDTFVGICGANLGLVNCKGVEENLSPTCNGDNGFYPGKCGSFFCSSIPTDASTYLVDLYNSAESQTISDFLFVEWSHADLLIGYGDKVYGEPTSRIPQQNGEYVSDTYGHMEMKEKTSAQVDAMINNHTAAVMCPCS